jgi:O-Antigen ligase
MFDKWLKLPAHYYLRITALLILVVGVAVSNVLMSIGAIWIISNWLIEAKFSDYGKRLKTTPEIILVLIFLGYSILSIAWSDDFWYAFHDIRIKLPLLAIPLALGTGKPLERNVFFFLLYVFIGIVAFTGVLNYLNYVTATVEMDIRQMSRFISQIRFATLVDLALFSAIYLVLEKKLHLLIALPLIGFFLFYTFYAQVLNGYILFAILFGFTFVYALTKIKNRLVKWSIVLILVTFAVTGTIYISSILKTYRGIDEYTYSELDLYTANGNPYFHDTSFVLTENGHYVWLYVQQDELEREWNKRSVIAYDSLDRKQQPMFGTLLRYLTSKNERKDSAGVWSLSAEEIVLIENGHTGINMNNGLEAKIHSFLFEYEMYSGGVDPNGFSLLQRLEHLKAAREILKTHWLLGVGIGDVDIHFQKYYEQTHSKLLPENRLRSHNQFVSTWIALGIIGLLVMLGIFIAPLLKKTKRDYFLWITLCALAVAFTFEDMLETQAGATIFALFYALAVFRETAQQTKG